MTDEAGHGGRKLGGMALVLRQLAELRQAVENLERQRAQDHAAMMALARQAGYRPEPAEAPRQRSVSRGAGLDADPDHDPRVVDLIMRGASSAELHRQLAEVAEARAAERQAAAEACGGNQHGGLGVLWTTRSGETLTDQAGAPRQRSVVYGGGTDMYRDYEPQFAQTRRQVPAQAPVPGGELWTTS